MYHRSAYGNTMRAMNTVNVKGEVELKSHLIGEVLWIILVLCEGTSVFGDKCKRYAQPTKHPSEATGSMIVLRLMMRVQDAQRKRQLAEPQWRTSKCR
jgi:hypothetical protein